MTLSEKIICLRKKTGWSQEQLAEKLNVNRQIIAKWESEQATPDVNKIVAMAALFHVTTDFLLKDEPQIFFNNTNIPPVTTNEVHKFLEVRKKVASSTALGVSLCILSAIYVLIGAGIGKLGLVNYNISLSIGMILLLVTVAYSVGLFIRNNNLTEPYQYLEKSEFTLTKQTEHQVKQEQLAYRDKHTKLLITGVILCILSVIPLFLGSFFTDLTSSTLDQIMLFLVAIMLIIISAGVCLIIKASITTESYDILLQAKEYSPEQKAGREKLNTFASIYWLTITMIYLAVSFFTHHWETSWMIWVFAGIFFSIINQFISHRKRPA